QFWVNADDADVVGWLKIFTFRTREEIEELAAAVQERPQAREAQRVLAADVTTLVHGAEATAQAIAASQALFGRGDLASIDAATLASAVVGLPSAEGKAGDQVADLLAATGLVQGRNAARRAIAEGGAYVNNAKVTD